ncbi:MAG TPA: hypothetical protein VK821_17355 [Dehalococcoidia bacterium]|nr:hypothetical protein [Dehalococcoidia bacterium]
MPISLPSASRKYTIGPLNLMAVALGGLSRVNALPGIEQFLYVLRNDRFDAIALKTVGIRAATWLLTR